MVRSRPMRTPLIELPDVVVAALAEPDEAEAGVVEANGIPFATRSWGDPHALEFPNSIFVKL